MEDLAKFAALQLRDKPAGGAQVLKGATLREMHRVHWLWPSWKGGWGLGFAVRRDGDQVRLSTFVRDRAFVFSGVEAGRYRLLMEWGGQTMEIEISQGESREVTVQPPD